MMMMRPSNRQGELLLQARRKREHSQSATATALGLHHYQQVSAIERGIQTIPREILKEAAHYCEVTVTELAKYMAADYYDLLTRGPIKIEPKKQQEDDDLLN